MPQRECDLGKGRRVFSGLFRGLAGLAGLLLMAGSAQAQVLSRTVPITFSGVVSSAVADTIKIIQSDGTAVPYTGPVPTYPYDKGQAVSITFNAVLPTREYFASPNYTGQVAADGIYRIALSTASSPSDVGAMTQPLGGFGDPVSDLSHTPTASMTIVYDANTDTYSLEGSGGLLAGVYAGAGFRYDGTTGQLIGCASSDACTGRTPGSFVLTGGADNSFGLQGDTAGTQITASQIPILDQFNNALAGFFSVTMSGSWDLPQFGGGATQVPEPGMLGLFSGGALLVAARRRRNRKA